MIADRSGANARGMIAIDQFQVFLKQYLPFIDPKQSRLLSFLWPETGILEWSVLKEVDRTTVTVASH